MKGMHSYCYLSLFHVNKFITYMHFFFSSITKQTTEVYHLFFFSCKNHRKNVKNDFLYSKCFVFLTKLLRKRIFFSNLYPYNPTYYAMLWQSFLKREIKKNLRFIYRRFFSPLKENIALFSVSTIDYVYKGDVFASCGIFC